jgi:hypothetical protein
MWTSERFNGYFLSVGSQSNGSEHYILFMFMTSPEKYEERNVIRKMLKDNVVTWGELISGLRPEYEVESAVKAIFFIGKPSNVQLMVGTVAF